MKVKEMFDVLRHHLKEPSVIYEFHEYIGSINLIENKLKNTTWLVAFKTLLTITALEKVILG